MFIYRFVYIMCLCRPSQHSWMRCWSLASDSSILPLPHQAWSSCQVGNLIAFQQQKSSPWIRPPNLPSHMWQVEMPQLNLQGLDPVHPTQLLFGITKQEHHGTPWNTMEHHGTPWNTNIVVGTSFKLQGIVVGWMGSDGFFGEGLS